MLAFDGDSDTDLTNRYLWGPVVDQILADEQVTSLGSVGDVIWPLTDHLGTARDLAQYNAGMDTTSITNHRIYDSFGNLVSETNAAVDHLFGFTARPWDEETELQYNLNRWYDPVVGQWMSEDPIGFEGLDPNLRRYVGNVSLTRLDYDGLEWKRTDAEGYIWRATEDGDTLEDLAMIVTGDPVDRYQIRPLGPKELWSDFPVAKKGARASVRELKKDSGQYVVIFKFIDDLKKGERDAYVEDMTRFACQDIPARATKIEVKSYEEFAAKVKEISQEGRKPIKTLIFVHHYNGEKVDFDILEKLKVEAIKEPTLDEAMEGRGPVQTWFTREAIVVDLSCLGKTIGDAIADQWLRKGAKVYSTPVKIYAGQTRSGGRVAGFDRGGNDKWDPVQDPKDVVATTLDGLIEFKEIEVSRGKK